MNDCVAFIFMCGVLCIVAACLLKELVSFGLLVPCEHLSCFAQYACNGTTNYYVGTRTYLIKHAHLGRYFNLFFFVIQS